MSRLPRALPVQYVVPSGEQCVAAPLLLTCGHSLCRSCVDRLLRSTSELVQWRVARLHDKTTRYQQVRRAPSIPSPRR